MNDEIGKRVNSIAAIAIVALVLLGVLAITHETTTAQSNTGPQKTIQVSGVGTASTTPDLSLLDFSVTSQAKTAARASSDNSAAVVDVMQALITLGYSEADIHTTSYSLQPLYDSSKGQSNAIVGYQIWNNMEVSTNNFTKIGVTIDAVVNAGVNQIQSVTFTFSNATLANLQSQALQRAVQDANIKATTIASALNVQLIGPIDVSPGFSYQPYVEAFTSNTPGTQIQPPSSLQVSVTVQITYVFT
ncbi:MAG: SIMPL domain-containing protein [Candidatus Bathyarchaeia archaeon]